MKILAIGLLMFSQFIFAQNNLQTIMEQNPYASNYEVLKVFYNESPQAAELNDFDKGENAQSNQECRMVYHHHSIEDELISIVIRQISKTHLGKNKLVLVGAGSLVDGKLSKPAIKTFNYISMDENAYDLIAHMKKNSEHPDSPFKLFLRKNADLISFKLLTYKNNQDNGPLFGSIVHEDYGYCWRE